MTLDKRSYALRVADILCKLEALRFFDGRNVERMKERFSKDTVEFCLSQSRRSATDVTNALVDELESLHAEANVWLSTLSPRSYSTNTSAAGVSTLS